MPITCLHPACNCEIEPNQEYCSVECEHARDEEPEGDCDCGHTGCGSSVERSTQVPPGAM